MAKILHTVSRNNLLKQNSSEGNMNGGADQSNSVGAVESPLI
jgi:hypothetical protein